MVFINRLLLVGLFSVGISAATTAQAGNQLFTASWTVKAFGNELTGTGGSGASALYSAWAIPQGILCNPNQPRCPFVSTPTDGAGNFAPLGGSIDAALWCAPWSNWQSLGTTVRPAKGATATTGGEPIPPLYRNPGFFTTGGQPDTNFCSGTSTNGTGGKGAVQVGSPVTGTWSATTTGTQLGGFNFAAAPVAPGVYPSGFRTTAQFGEFSALYPYVYSYTYATLRNEAGTFGPGSGPGSFGIVYKKGANTVASIRVKQGAAKFGGVMRMLGAFTVKVCYFRVGGCSIGTNDWRYEAVGATAYTTAMFGKVSKGYQALYTAVYYNTALMQFSTVNVVGSRFPWTTGSVTVKATGRGPHKTVHYAQGYDNRNTTTAYGKGTIQLVTPVMTRWLQNCCKFETAGVGILRIKFIPEPQTWVMLVAGASLLGVGYRMRGR
jgi:hypothetical protein